VECIGLAGTQIERESAKPLTQATRTCKKSGIISTYRIKKQYIKK